MKQVFGSICIGLGLLANICGAAFSQERIEGEIINANHQYRIAFTDMSNRYLKVEDIVEIYAGGNFVGYLEVAETSGVISKLIPARQKVNFKTDVDFRKITVGSKVVKILPPDEARADVPTVDRLPIQDSWASKRQLPEMTRDRLKPPDDFARMAKEKEVLQDDYDKLRKELETSLQRLEELEAKNMLLSQENDDSRRKNPRKKHDPNAEKIKKMRETNAVLKKKLEYMSRLVDENIKAYESK